MKTLTKKGIEMLDYPIWILRIVFLAILIISIGFMITKYINIRVDVTGIESAVVLQRILSSPAIMYTDKLTSHLYPAVIDLAKMTTADETLAKDIDFGRDKRHIAAHVHLDNKNTDIYLNKRLFEDLKIQLGTLFGSDVQATQQTLATFDYDNDNFVPDTLTIEVLEQR